MARVYEVEPNGYGTPLSPNIFGVEIRATITAYSDVDCFRFDGVDGPGTFRISLLPNSTYSNSLRISLRDASQEIFYADSGTSVFSATNFSYAVTESKDYFVCISPLPIFTLESLTSPASYRLSVDFFPTLSQTINGSIAGENIYGGGQSEYIRAQSGDDVIYLSGGSDLVDGGLGLDYLVINKLQGWNYLLRSDGVVQLTNRAGYSEYGSFVRLRDVERVAEPGFDTQSGVRVFGWDDVSEQAYRIYKAAFNRQPDAGGLGYWIAKMDDGMDLIEVASRFIDSGEFRSLYGSHPTSGQFITALYQNVLGRTPDEDGYDWWVEELQTNPEKTWQKVLADFSESSENVENVEPLITVGVPFLSWVE